MRMRSSERWKKALRCGGVLGTRRRRLGSSNGGRRCGARGAEVRERDGAHRVEEGVSSALELSTGGGEGRGVGRECMPSTRRR
jgi:hypothetical protein